MALSETVYYNEVDHNAAEWLRALIAGGLIPAGTVDERSIADVGAADLAGYTQCHFFAGIGGWPYALSLAGWQGPVWTGSCPCQPLSVAGQGKGDADQRHLWPAFQHLIAECKPATVFGEQVAGKAGREWLAGIRADLEGAGYAVGAADLCAAGVGAPHIRQRLYWVADASRGSRQRGFARADKRATPPRNGKDCRVADAEYALGRAAQFTRDDVIDRHDAGWPQTYRQPGACSAVRAPWEHAAWLPCLDGKARRVEPGIFPLADGVPARVGRLRGYGNAIVPQVAAAFVSAFMEVGDGAN